MVLKRLSSLCYLLLYFALAANALHFYLDANEKRCFIEELPTDTVVEGELCDSKFWSRLGRKELQVTTEL